MNVQDLLTIAVELFVVLAVYVCVAGLICTFRRAIYSAIANCRGKKIQQQTEFLLMADYQKLLAAAKQFKLTDQLKDRKKKTLAYAIAAYQVTGYV